MIEPTKIVILAMVISSMSRHVQRPEQPISCSLWRKPSDHGTWECTFGMLHLRPIIKQWFMHSYGGHFEKQSFSDNSNSFVHLLHPYHP